MRLEADERLYVLAPQVGPTTQAEDRAYPREYLVTCLRRYHSQAELLTPTATDGVEASRAILATTGERDTIIVLTVNAHRDHAQAELVTRLYEAGRRVIVVAVAQPYDLLAFPHLPTYLTTYEYTRPALEAVTRVLFGEVRASGRLPVSLPGLYAMEE